MRGSRQRYYNEQKINDVAFGKHYLSTNSPMNRDTEILKHNHSFTFSVRSYKMLGVLGLF